MIALPEYLEDVDMTGRSRPTHSDEKDRYTGSVDTEVPTATLEAEATASSRSRDQVRDSSSRKLAAQNQAAWPRVPSLGNDFAAGLQRSIAANQKASSDLGTPVVLDQFQGKVNAMRDGTAFVTLQAEDGTLFHGTRDARTFEQLGIEVGDSFSCQTLRDQDGVSVSIKPIQLIEVTDEEIDSIGDEIDRLFDSE